MGHYYLLTLKDKKVGFICINRFPHPIVKNQMTISRLVIVPEFQGFGIGEKFMTVVSDLYKNDRIRITTSLKPFITSLKRSKNWLCVRFGRAMAGKKTTGSIHKYMEGGSFNRITATFERINNGTA